MSNYDYILKRLRPYGSPEVFGSARFGKEFINMHDVDIGLVTYIDSKQLLTKVCTEIIQQYGSFSLPLHFIVIGNFDYEFRYIKVKDVKHIIQFIPRKLRYLICLKVKILKFIQFVQATQRNVRISTWLRLKRLK